MTKSYVAHNARLYSVDVDTYISKTEDRSAIEPFLRRFQERLPVGGRVLDLGCGPGYEAATLHARGYVTVGFDFSDAFLRSAHDSYITDGWVRGDMRSLPFEPRSFDGVWACASMHHLEAHDLEDGLNEAARVLRPGGTLVASFKSGIAGQYLPEPSGSRGLYYAYQPPGALRAQLIGAGFEIVEFDIDIPAQPPEDFAEGQTGWLTVTAGTSGSSSG